MLTNTFFFVCLCLQVESTAEGEAQRYFDHALTLKNTILFLRYNKELTQDQGPDIPNIGNYTVTPSLSLPSWICKIKMYMSVHVVNKQLAGQVGFCVFHLARWLWFNFLSNVNGWKSYFCLLSLHSSICFCISYRICYFKISLKAAHIIKTLIWVCFIGWMI